MRCLPLCLGIPEIPIVPVTWNTFTILPILDYNGSLYHIEWHIDPLQSLIPVNNNPGLRQPSHSKFFQRLAFFVGGSSTPGLKSGPALTGVHRSRSIRSATFALCPRPVTCWRKFKRWHFELNSWGHSKHSNCLMESQPIELERMISIGWLELSENGSLYFNIPHTMEHWALQNPILKR